MINISLKYVLNYYPPAFLELPPFLTLPPFWVKLTTTLFQPVFKMPNIPFVKEGGRVNNYVALIEWVQKGYFV